ncbi:MAG: protein-L-isoaspartate O-methyltransferase, partial [Candidatus Buchananbacteria bacterium]|nr:protein-L-isoaspartate O-methyltransferase [Candidatus Buchananbacteria bacterium]
IISELKEFGENNCKKYNFSNIEFFCQDGYSGLPDQAPFDRILVSAAALEIPDVLKSQLIVGGKLVIPTAAQDIRVIERISEVEFKEAVYPGFIFVPLVKS